MKKILALSIFLIIIGCVLSPAQSARINVEVIDKARLSKIINERNGKILFLNLWATWCVPCREEFPEIVKLAGIYKNEVDFIGISADYPDEVKSKIVPFLKSNKANFASFVSGFKKDEDLINALDKKWNGALPATFIFDRKGNKLILLEGKKTFDEFKAEIDKALIANKEN
jgi:thiol-disulfide isomerase/thioredoxin